MRDRISRLYVFRFYFVRYETGTSEPTGKLMLDLILLLLGSALILAMAGYAALCDRI